MSELHFEVDEKAIGRLIRKIIVAESNNLKTKDKTDTQMIDIIKKWISEEVQCS